MHKQDLALTNQEWLICHKTWLGTKKKKNTHKDMHSYMIYFSAWQPWLTINLSEYKMIQIILEFMFCWVNFWTITSKFR